SEKQRERMRVAVMERHTYSGFAHLGYLNVRSRTKDQPNIEPQEPAFSLVGMSFEKMKTGNYSPAACLREMTALGLRSKFGNKLTVQGFKNLLQNEAYIGKSPSKRYGTQPGRHQPCVSQDTFRRVQLILNGKKPTTSAYLRNREELPLRRFLKCPNCFLKC